MKTAKALLGILTITAGFVMNGTSQVYHLSIPISGHISQGEGGTLYFSNLDETIYLDVPSQTIRQVGTISFQNPVITFQGTQTQQVPQDFPNPPVDVVGTYSVTIAMPSGVISFDTGTQPLTGNGGSYSVNGDINNLQMAVSYSLLTGGETYSGNITQSLTTVRAAFVFRDVSASNYPASISVSGLGGTAYDGEANYGIAGGTILDVTATNGFRLLLRQNASYSFPGYGCDMWYWGCNQPVTSTNVPIGIGAASITNQPQSVVVHAHDTASLTVSASGAVPLSYQWSLNGTNISGATSSTLTIPNVIQSNLGAYAVIVTNAFGSETSSNAMLSMFPFLSRNDSV